VDDLRLQNEFTDFRFTNKKIVDRQFNNSTVNRVIVNFTIVYLQNEIHPVIGIFCPGDDFRLVGSFLFDHFPSEIQ